MDKNQEHAKINSNPAETYGNLKVENDQLQLKVQELQGRFRVQKEPSMLEKTHVVYRMRRKTLEDVKIGIKNIDDYIAEAHILETTSIENIISQPSTSSSTETSSESYELEMNMKV